MQPSTLHTHAHTHTHMHTHKMVHAPVLWVYLQFQEFWSLVEENCYCDLEVVLLLTNKGVI